MFINVYNGQVPNDKACSWVVDGGNVGHLWCPFSLEFGGDHDSRLRRQQHLLPHHQLSMGAMEHRLRVLAL